MNDPLNLIDPFGLYGTGDCSYYGSRCYENKGDYYCKTAPYFCKKFPSDKDKDKGWGNCTRKCLQDEDRKYRDKMGKCTDAPDENTDGFWDGQNFDAHVKCYLKCSSRIPSEGL